MAGGGMAMGGVAMGGGVGVEGGVCCALVGRGGDFPQ